MANGKPNPKLKRLTKEQLADTSRYKLREEELELPELGGSVLVKSVTVGKRRELPSMRDEDGNPTKEGQAAWFSTVIVDPPLTPDEVEGFIDDLPAMAFDRVNIKVAELVGTEEERRDTVQEFRPAEDES
jgi:hypothetical protein